MICDLNVGSIPVVVDHQSLALVGVTTDRDLCCRALPHSLDATSTRIQEFVTYNPRAICRDGENVEQCELLSESIKRAEFPRRQGQPRDRHHLAG